MQRNKYDDVIFDNKVNFAKLNDFYIGVVIDEHGNEGLIASVRKDGDNAVIHPMIGGTPADKKAILEIANEMAKRLGRKIKIIRFSSRSIIKECTP